MEAYQDGVNANRYGSDYIKTVSTVNKTTGLKIRLAEGGGWAARIHATQ
jgi:alpha-glucosidase